MVVLANLCTKWFVKALFLDDLSEASSWSTSLGSETEYGPGAAGHSEVVCAENVKRGSLY